MDLALPIVLLVFGFALLVLEVFIPSMRLLSIASLGCLLGSMVLGFRESTTIGFTMLGAAAVGVPTVLYAAFKLFPSTPLGKHMILSGIRRLGSVTRTERLDLLGKEGVTVSALRPSGIAVIEGRRLDVITRGELIEAGVRIAVVENRGNRFVVRSVEPPAPEEHEEELR